MSQYILFIQKHNKNKVENSLIVATFIYKLVLVIILLQPIPFKKYELLAFITLSTVTKNHLFEIKEWFFNV